jgi:hypothetical protein
MEHDIYTNVSRPDMVRIAREELTRLDAEAQARAAAHEAAAKLYLAALPQSKERKAREKEVAERRYADGCAANAFEGARRLAERLGLIGEGEREFYKEKKA